MRGFELSESEFIEVCELVNGGSIPGMSRLGRLLCFGGFLLLSSVAIPLGVTQGDWRFAAVYLSVVAGFLLFAFFARYIWRRERRKEFAARSDIAEHTECHFDEDQIEWRGESGSKRLRWEQLAFFMENSKFYVLFEYKTMGSIVPKRAFESEAEHQRFVALLESNGIKRKR